MTIMSNKVHQKIVSTDTNKDGKVDVKKRYKNDKLTGKSVFSYKGNKVVEEKYDSNNVFESKVVYQKNQIKGSYPNSKGIEYDSNGKIINYIETSNLDKKLSFSGTNEYNKEGLRVRTLADLDSDGKIDEIITLKYNKDGKIKKQVLDKGADGKTDLSVKYSYDSAGHMTKKVIKKAGEKKLILKF